MGTNVTDADLEQFLADQRRLMVSPRELNEANTRLYIIDRLLRLAGWEFRPGRVEVENRITITGEEGKTRSGFVDYVLRDPRREKDGPPVAIVEAKNPDVILGLEQIQQVAAYGSAIHADVCLLSNGIWVIAVAPGQYNAGEMPDPIGAFQVQNVGQSHLHHLSPDGIQNLLHADGILQRGVPYVDTIDLPSIERSALRGHPGDIVHVVTSRSDGIPWMKGRQAWGPVRFTEKPAYVGVYVKTPVKGVKYVAKVTDLERMDAWLDSIDDVTYQDTRRRSDPPERDMIVIFDPKQMWKLAEPIPLGSGFIRGSRRVPLETFRAARTVADF